MNSELWIQAIVWMAVLSYLLAGVLYTYVIYEQTDIYLQLVHLIIVIGFFILTVQTYKKAKKLHQDPDRINDPSFLFDRWTQVGWGFIALFFILIYIPEETSLHLHWYFPIGFLAYFNLYLGHYLGVYLLILFYLISIYSYPPHSPFSSISYFTKVGTFLYMCIFGYYYIHWYQTYKTPLI